MKTESLVEGRAKVKSERGDVREEIREKVKGELKLVWVRNI